MTAGTASVGTSLDPGVARRSHDDDASCHPFAGLLATLPPVCLDDLEREAGLLTRTERKYVVPLEAVRDVVVDLAGQARVLEIGGARDFGYESVYLDTPELTSFTLAAHRRPTRFKVRTRTYLDSGEHWLEVKTKDRRGRTVKERRPHTGGSLDVADLTFVREALAAAGVPVPPTDLRPTLTTSYRRRTLLLPGGRVTIDTDLTCREPGGAVTLAGHAVIESKTPRHACAVDHALWHRGYRPVRVSKYCTGLAALDPRLPASRWRPVLRRHPFVSVPSGRTATSPNPSPLDTTDPTTTDPVWSTR